LSKYDVLTVGETPHTSIDEAVKYADASRHELNMVFHFDHMHLDYDENGKFSTKRFQLSALKEVFTRWQTGMAEHNGWNSLYWSNHDQARPVTRFGADDTKWRTRSAKMLGTILHMQQGTPYIYQGEELGMTNAKFKSIDDYQDIETKNIYKDFIHNKKLGEDYTMKSIYLKSRDNARTPMQWSKDDNAGFTKGTPWIRLNPNYSRINVKDTLADSNSVFYYYQKLIELRHNLPIITTGKYVLLDKDNESTYTFLRETNKQILFVTGNFTDKNQFVNLPKEIANKKGDLIISNFEDKASQSDKIDLPPYGTSVYLYNK